VQVDLTQGGPEAVRVVLTQFRAAGVRHQQAVIGDPTPDVSEPHALVLMHHLVPNSTGQLDDDAAGQRT